MSAIQSSTVVLEVTFRRPMRFRRGSNDGIEVDADKDSFTLSNDMIRSEHYIQCEAVQRKLDCYLRTRRLEAPLRKGVYLIPIGVLDEVYQRLEEAKREYNEAADKLAAEWNEIVEDAKKRLRQLFNPKRFPEASRVRSAFAIEWRLLQWSVPNEASLGEVLYKLELEKAKAFWAEAEQEVSLGLREAMLGLVSKLATSLTEADGKRKVLKQPAVDKINDFLDSFGKRNVLDDQEMVALVKKAKKLLAGKDAEDLRNSKEKISAQFKTIESKLSELVTEQKRAFDFGD